MLRWPAPIALTVLMSGCAAPVAPTGGPVDATPPELVDMYPPSNSVGFTGQAIRFEFSERVDRGSFERALSIVPETGGRQTFNWDGRRVEVTFSEPLSEATTYVITIDNAFRDERNVALRQPIVRAVSTGPFIDSGVLKGAALDADTGKPVSGIDVVATRADSTGLSRPEPIRYRTQTGPDGKFELRFLPDVPFSVAVFEDRNRNRVLDGGEQFAVAPRPVLIPVRADSTIGESRWWVSDPDTTRPAIAEVRARTNRTVELRYSEPVRLETIDAAGWAVRDSALGVVHPAREVYLNPSDRRWLVLVVDSLRPTVYFMERFAAVRDSSGNPAEQRAGSFRVPSTADTTQLRFLGFEPSAAGTGVPIRLTTRQRPRLRFNRFVSPERIQAEVSTSDTLGPTRQIVARSHDGTTWDLEFQPPVAPGDTVRVSVPASLAGDDSSRTAGFYTVGPDELGSLSGVVVPSEPFVLEVYSERGAKRNLVDAVSAMGNYSIPALEAGNYKIRVFADRDGDGKWNWGAVDPFEAPEPLTWYPDSARVRAGWETVLDTLRLDSP